MRVLRTNGLRMHTETSTGTLWYVAPCTARGINDCESGRNYNVKNRKGKLCEGVRERAVAVRLDGAEEVVDVALERGTELALRVRIERHRRVDELDCESVAGNATGVDHRPSQ